MFQRFIDTNLSKALSRSPVVLLLGARQSGKSTLVRDLMPKSNRARYITLDDANIFGSASENPQAFIESLQLPVIIDEVQRVPELFRAIKLVVDRKRQAGGFLLTGSTNIFLLPRLSESLAGRMEIVKMCPLSVGEILGLNSQFIDRIFDGTFKFETVRAHSPSLLVLALRGGYPEIQKKTEEDRLAWLGSYITSVLERDVREIADIEKLGLLPKVLGLLSYRLGALLNTSDLSSMCGIPHTTLSKYLASLEATFILQFLPPWSMRSTSRLTKSRKIYFTDTAIAAYFSGGNEATIKQNPEIRGRILENFVLLELMKQESWSKCRCSFYHFRAHKGQEVDFILEDKAGRVVGIEVKSSSILTGRDVAGLKFLAGIIPKRFHRGIVLYGGDTIMPLNDNVWAVPIASLWHNDV